MALEGAHADEGYANIGGTKDGPVLTMMSKRLRALKKKYNRILQIEENKRQGKTVNKEQEDVLRQKIAVAALIDEYEKLRHPLMAAVKEEVAEREKELLAASLEREDSAGELEQEVHSEVAGTEESRNGVEQGEKAVHENGGEAEVQEPDVSGAPGVIGNEEETEVPEAEKVESVVVVQENMFSEGDVGDLLKLLYFAHLFDVRSQGEAPSLVWTRVHERSSCLSYDFVTDDTTSPLIEADLDALSMFGSMLTSRPPNETLSHRDALERCIEHAREWLRSSDRDVYVDTSYSRLRERLSRILSSEYFTMTPELQTVSQQTAAAAASAAGQYLPTKDADHSAPPAFYVPQEAQAPVSQGYELGASGGPPASSPPLVFLSEKSVPAFEMPQFGSHGCHEEANAGSPEESEEVQGAEQASEEAATGDGQGQGPVQGQGQQHQYTHHQQGGGGRSGTGYQQQGGPGRGRGVAGGYQGMGGRNGGRGYMNNGPRGGRGRGGMFPNNGGRGGQFYEQPGVFHPRPNHYGGGGRGGRGGRGGAVYNGQGQQVNGAGGSPAAAAPSPARTVE